MPSPEITAALAAVQASVPDAMRQRQQWLLWRFQSVEGEKKPRKIPFYVSGRKRQGVQGSVEDRAELATFEIACAHLAHGNYTGLGFAFLPGDGLIGVDIDGAIDPESGEVSQRCEAIIAACASYTEYSPSGKGVHIIVEGECQTTKDDGIGLEVFCGRQYFTVTGNPWPGVPAQVAPIAPDVLRRLIKTVEDAKEATRAAKAAQTAQARRPATAAPGSSGGVNDFARVNAAALALMDAWVPDLFPGARKAPTGGWRITSKALGRKLQEDLSLHPDGIQDFGDEEGLTPIDTVIKFSGKSPKDALHWLAGAIGMSLTKPARRGQQGALPPPHTEAPPAAPGEGGAPENEEADDQPPSGIAARFALIYGSDTAWDRHMQMLVRIPALRLAFGRTAINHWLGREDRCMVLPTDLVFEPGANVPAPQINMFGGLKLDPTPCDGAEVAPMINLLRHLCAESAETADEIDQIVHWILCWQAMPVQHLGTKMQTACVFHGAQGTGKNLYWDMWRDLFGVYGITVGQTELEDKFNGWVSRKLAIIGDEVVSRQEMYHNKNRLKLVVTQEEKFPIRGMLQETRWESNHANVVFLSNESQPLALEDRDRRYMVVYTPLEADAALYEAVRDFKAKGGAAKWLHYLMTYPLDGFSAHTKPPMTRAKEALIEAGWKASARFGHEWLSGVLDLPLRVCSAEQLYKAFRKWCDDRGERWPPSQAEFTGQLNRWMRERVTRDANGRYGDPALTYKVVQFKKDGQRKAVRCWLPSGCGPVGDISEGQWAAESAAEFENALWKFTRRRGGSDEDEAA